MGLTICTDDRGTKVYKQIKTNTNGENYAVYSTTFSNKDNSGNWKSAYFTIKFPKGVDVSNKSVIKIKHAFPSFNANSANGHKYPYIQIMDFEIIEEGEDGLSTTIDSMDDLPFM